MLPTDRIVVSPDEFDVLFSQQTRIAKFPTPAAEQAYEQRDSELIARILQQVIRHFGPGTQSMPCVGEDWWPNHTRYVELYPEHCTAAFLCSLVAELANGFADYRIQCCVYEETSEETKYLGSMALSTDQLLVEHKLYELLCLKMCL